MGPWPVGARRLKPCLNVSCRNNGHARTRSRRPTPDNRIPAVLYKKFSYSDLTSVWRIIVAVIVFELAGGFAGVAYGYHHFAFKNLWAGGALAALPGFIFGAIWQFSGPVDRRDTIPIAGFLGLLSALLFLAAVFQSIPGMKSDMRMLATLSQFDSKPIDRIEIFDRDRKMAILTVTEPDIVAAFTRSISDAVGHSPSHPQFSHSWYAVVSGPKKYEFELHLDPNYPDSVIGYSLTRTEHPASYQVTFRSGALRAWVEEHLVRGRVAD